MSTTVSSLPFSLPLNHNSRVSLFNSPSYSVPSQSPHTFPIIKWRILCLRHENSSPETNSPQFKEEKLSEEDNLSEDLVKFKGDRSKDLKRDWLATVHTVINVIRSVEPWTVPWTAKTIVQVMLLWIASFWFVGSWIVPFLAYTAGFRKEYLSYRGQAFYSLLTDVAEGVVGIGILHHCLAKFQPLSSDWFKFELKGKWQFDVVLGCLMFPLINHLSQMNLNLLPVLQYTPVTISSVEQSIVARDPVAMALYAVVVSVCAPIWEEIVFRGFLLPSLTRIQQRIDCFSTLKHPYKLAPEWHLMTNSYRMSACGLPNVYSHILPSAELVVMILPCEIYLQCNYFLLDKNSVNFYQNTLIFWVLPACMNGATFFS